MSILDEKFNFWLSFFDGYWPGVDKGGMKRPMGV